MTHPSSRARAVALLTCAALALTIAACDDDDDPAATADPVFVATLTGANERPNPVTTTAAGTATVTVSSGTASYVVTYAGINGAPTGAHIHAPGSAAQAVGVVVDFPRTTAAAGTGTLTGTFTAADIRAPTGQTPMSMDSLVTLMRAGNAYVNVHTSVNPGGEIRGQLNPR
ncbi:MAG: CHRD domain-containing protein [Gemmatirosa sp.]